MKCFERKWVVLLNLDKPIYFPIGSFAGFLWIAVRDTEFLSHFPGKVYAWGG